MQKELQKKIMQDKNVPRYAFHVTRGFTFIELIVVLSIMTIIMGVILFNFRGFSNNVTLQNLAQDIALNIKKAQTSAISGSTSGFDPGQPPSYGVSFDLTGGASSHFTYFRDLGVPDGKMNGNCSHAGEFITNDLNNECLAVTSITSTDRITDLSNGGQSLTHYPKLYLSFARPFPDSIIYGIDASGVPHLITTGAQIEVTSQAGQKKTIILWPVGQISVVDGSPTSLFLNNTTE